MTFFPTAEDKRRMGEGCLALDVNIGMAWIERAAAQEAGSLDEYEAAVKAWEAAKPRARDFVPADVREALVTREAEACRVAQAEFQAIWGPLFPGGVAREGTFPIVKRKARRS